MIIILTLFPFLLTILSLSSFASAQEFRINGPVEIPQGRIIHEDSIPSPPNNEPISLAAQQNLPITSGSTLNQSQYYDMLKSLYLYGEWYSANNSTQQGGGILNNYGYMTLNATLVEIWHLFSKNEYYHRVNLTINDGWTVERNNITLQFNMEELGFNQENSSFYGNVPVVYSPINANCTMFMEVAFLNTTTNTPLNQVPNANFTDAGIKITVAPVGEDSQCPLNFTTNALTTQPFINGSTLNETQYYDMMDGLYLYGDWYSADNATQENGVFVNDYGYMTLNSTLIVIKHYFKKDEYYHQINLTINDGWTLLENPVTLQFNMEQLGFDQENSSFYGNISVQYSQGTTITDCNMLIELAFINTTTNSPLNQVPDSNFTDAGIKVWALSLPESSQCPLSLASSSLTTNSVINGSNINASLYYDMLNGLNLYGQWYSVDNATEQGGSIMNDYGYMGFNSTLVSGDNYSSNDESYHQIGLTINDGWMLNANFISFLFYIEDLEFSPKNSSFYGNINVHLATSDYVSTECNMFIYLAFIDTTTNTPFNPTPYDDFTNAGMQIWTLPITSTSQCNLNLTTTILTTQSVINGSSVNVTQFYNMLNSLDLYGKWYSADNATQQGEDISHEYGYMSFNASQESSYHSIGLTVYDGWTILGNYVTLEFNIEKLGFSPENSSFVGNINIGIYRPDYKNCSAYVELDFIDTTTGAPLSLSQYPGSNFAHGGIQIKISSNNDSQCTLDFTTSILTTESPSYPELRLYGCIMSIPLFIGTICGIIILLQFPVNSNRLKTTRLWSIWTIASWQFFQFGFGIVNGINAGSFWVVLPGLIGLANIIILARISIHHLVVTNRERSYRSYCHVSWPFGLIPMLFMALFYVLATLVPSAVWAFLISCVYMVPQISRKHKEGHRTEIYWLFNIGFGLTELAYMAYRYAYPDNMFANPINIPFFVVYVITFVSQALILFYWKRRPRSRVQGIEELYQPINARNRAAENSDLEGRVQAPQLQINEYAPPIQEANSAIRQAHLRAQIAEQRQEQHRLLAAARAQHYLREFEQPVEQRRQRRSTQPRRKASGPRHVFPSDQCSICIEDFTKPAVDPEQNSADPDDHDAAIIAPCGHFFHRMCLKGWFERHKDCPCCRKNLSGCAL